MARNAESFDFIVAGAGSAGCVLAVRLSNQMSSESAADRREDQK